LSQLFLNLKIGASGFDRDEYRIENPSGDAELIGLRI
jgi:hypothetical protein